MFAIESFLDEIASASGLDPYQVRRKLLEGKPDWLKVLDTAAEKGDWGKPLPRGTARGIAICEDTDSLCAQVAEVTVKPNGDVKVNRVTVALDTRYMVNPQTIAEQAEGSVIFGLSAALFGKITIKDGASCGHDQMDRARFEIAAIVARAKCGDRSTRYRDKRTIDGSHDRTDACLMCRTG